MNANVSGTVTALTLLATKFRCNAAVLMARWRPN
jgi:hypothetical protein